MKTTILRTLRCTIAAAACLAGFLVAPSTASAAASDAVTNNETPATLSVSVTVPDGGEPVTFVADGKPVTIKAGETATLPGNAKNIKLPKGTIFTVVSTSADGAESSNTYDVNKAVTLATLTPETLKAKTASFTLTAQAGDIKLPSGAMIDLMNELRRLARQSVNPFDLLSEPSVTDAN